MRCLANLLLTTILVSTCFAQKKPPAFNPDSDAPDAVFSGASLRNLGGDRPDRQSEFSIKVKNIGTKVITAVEWEVALQAVISYSESKKYHFRGEGKEIKPGETKKLSGYMDSLITPNHTRAVVRIIRVEFSDKSVWEREKK